ncbi:unnamed protein product [Adineta steineri]|uniref:Uncharacterized protein n=1 Tax=Adineta steineri TaxID=433720 RepID=A0A819TJR0_9BILA|nr:unnamed protein product [Adineta steineri]CAF0762796.1 unnamed protein product [Adineta steineri]CAF3752982.1 unnamed protein product [Adineta steineri]CAF4082450.1 unnamed protein product [Adineta steineri]
MIQFVEKPFNVENGSVRWWIPYWWVLLRDGFMIVTAIIVIIVLKYGLIRNDELSDSTLYIPVDKPSIYIVTPIPLNSRRRRRRIRRHFRCVLVRSVVFQIIHHYQRRDRHRSSRHHRRRF